jgi:hypothetical protein
MDPCQIDIIVPGPGVNLDGILASSKELCFIKLVVVVALDELWTILHPGLSLFPPYNILTGLFCGATIIIGYLVPFFNGGMASDHH